MVIRNESIMNEFIQDQRRIDFAKRNNHGSVWLQFALRARCRIGLCSDAARQE
jgi:hypothetical protein